MLFRRFFFHGKDDSAKKKKKKDDYVDGSDGLKSDEDDDDDGDESSMVHPSTCPVFVESVCPFSKQLLGQFPRWFSAKQTIWQVGVMLHTPGS